LPKVSVASTMRASISTWRTGTSSLVIMSWICSRREGMSEMNSWLVRGSAMTLPRELSRLPALRRRHRRSRRTRSTAA
jgi:hypothetical protein